MEIVAYDEAGNESRFSYSTYTIDKTAPGVDNMSMNRDAAQHNAAYNVSFTVRDNDDGVGLWQLKETYEPVALQYGVSSHQSCDDFTSL